MIKYNIHSDIINSNIQKISQHGYVYFAVKANMQPKILQVISKNIYGWIVSDYRQLCSLIDAKIPLNNVIHINVASSESERLKLYSKGIKRFCFSDLDSLISLNQCCPDIEPFVRLCINEFEQSASHIGASKKEFVKMAKYLMQNNKPINIQLYFDRNCKREWFQIIQDIYTFLSSLRQFGFTINALNVGGISLNSVDKIKNLAFDIKDVNIEAGEPILKNAIDCETDIKAFTNDCLFLGTGIYTGALDVVLYNKRFNIELLNGISLLSDSPTKLFHKLIVCGPSCDTKDILGEYYIEKTNLSVLKKGEIVVIKDVGAYFQCFDMNYCSDYKQEVEVNES